MGDLLGNAVRFGIGGEVMAAGEGIETVLSLRQVLPDMPMLAALSAAQARQEAARAALAAALLFAALLGTATERLVVKPGPNNPVGVVWIDLNKPSYGIHGAPDPELVGKTASHGCVRLTNWDVQLLAARVKPGVQVVFQG